MEGKSGVAFARFTGWEEGELLSFCVMRLFSCPSGLRVDCCRDVELLPNMLIEERVDSLVAEIEAGA